jgi:hypothetical protein
MIKICFQKVTKGNNNQAEACQQVQSTNGKSSAKKNKW